MRTIDYDLAWGSHLPILMKVMSLSKGDVLELGAGLYSTPFLYWLCKDQERKFVSFENDFDWWRMVWNIKDVTQETMITRIIEGAVSCHIADWNDLDLENMGRCSVAFIDHSPSRRRIIDIKALANKADFVVIHDTQRNYKFCDFKQIYPLFRYRYDYDKSIPHTTVLSNFINLEEALK